LNQDKNYNSTPQKQSSVVFKRSQISSTPKMKGSTPKQKIEVIIDGDNDHDYLKDEEE
jgi:hypothetical protein